jgi:hypothetical protein
MEDVMDIEDKTLSFGLPILKKYNHKLKTEISFTDFEEIKLQKGSKEEEISVF